MIAETEKTELFRLYPVLAALDPLLRAKVLEGSRLVCLGQGTQVFNAFDDCHAFPFVLSGDLRVYKQSETGRQLSLYHVRAGDACIVSAGCLLGDRVYNAAGIVQEDACLIMMPSEVFDLLLAEKVFRKFIFSLISDRILGLMQLVEEVAFHRLDRRLAALLIQKGPRVRASHQELADELGTVREMVTRVLNSFADEGIVDLGREQIQILREKELEAWL